LTAAFRRVARRSAIPGYELVTQAILGWPRMQPFLALKRVLLRSLGARVGKRVTIYPGVWIMPISGKLVLGDDVDLAKDVLITIAGGVVIGDRTLVGYGAKILSANHAVPKGTLRIVDAGHVTAAINIGRDVWIGANVVILPGVTIGDGAVIAAGTVVTKSVPAYTIMAGVPGRPLRSRLEEADAAGLE
jgi:acetyltransferase-like isoleucine patch superfamily enzyme